MDRSLIRKAASAILQGDSTVAFTGAGISVESGVPPFRGENGIWNQFDPATLELDFFLENPAESWKVIRELFYQFFGSAKSNGAHVFLAKLEEKGFLSGIITQNIDNLHQQAGSKRVFEFHGNSQKLICLACLQAFKAEDINLDDEPPRCSCGGLIKPDFIFFGEGIPTEAYNQSIQAASHCDVMLVIGSTGEVMPAAQMPWLAKQHGALVIEVNTEKSNFTNQITDIFLQGKATEISDLLFQEIEIGNDS